MVLVIKAITKLAGFVSFLLITSCVNAEVTINSNSTRCIAELNEQSIALEIQPPCSVVKVNQQGKGFHQYKGVKVYIVSGAPTPLEQLGKWSVDNCSLISQAVFVENGLLSLSKVREKSLVCPDIGLDEKVYRDFLRHKI
ncbi:hypothetical protein FLM48_06645 [Shewanella sp. Scap07]|uniref:hypothetical protein n=1 Tax=Shewanella sp. Scap07 TaxID=2589987 RepID=UPI0015BB0470|nr:hypothetical protein [Shewanella sp. Scap07]QLE84790.1 hypothetical protein FLM48_06645 [Shewanella sp. Scap07]